MNTIQLAKRFEYDDWGGAESVVLETSKRLIRMGHAVEVFCTLNPGGQEYETVDGVPVRRFPYFYPYFGLNPRARDALHRKGGSPFSFAMMRALAGRPELDLIHLHTMGRFGGIGRRIARKRRIPYVVSLHGGVFDVPPDEIRSLAQPRTQAFEWGKPLDWWVGARRILTDASAVLCVGLPESRLAQERLPDTRVLYLPNGVDADRFACGDGQRFRRGHGISDDAYVLLNVARIDSQKNQLLLVECLPRLREVRPTAQVVLIGPVTNPSYLESIRERARRDGLEHAVTIIEGLPAGSRELVDAYHAADLFVLPSIHEPFGIVILEAWAAGRPVVASAVGGVPHFVANGEDGILFDPRDAHGLLEAFRTVSEHADTASRIARAGREKACTQYTWDVASDRLASLYAELIENEATRR